MAKTDPKKNAAQKTDASRKKRGASWISDTESTIEELRHTRAEIRRRIREQDDDLDQEAEILWEEQEERWQRLEVGLNKVAVQTGDDVAPSLAAEIESLMNELEDSYEELDALVD
jgi:benzoyl-CoA reductase/2-hydroxyglutaryl-CoA dehydratase subunit BcrC/BadD/HgdB